MRKENNIFLIDNGKKIKANHLNSSKLHLNRKGAKILSTSFLQHISRFPNDNWQVIVLIITFRIILVHLNIDSIRNKSDCLSE